MNETALPFFICSVAAVDALAAHFTRVHPNPTQPLQPSKIGDTVLSDNAFFADVRKAAEAFIAEVEADVTRQSDMNARLLNVNIGGPDLLR